MVVEPMLGAVPGEYVTSQIVRDQHTDLELGSVRRTSYVVAAAEVEKHKRQDAEVELALQARGSNMTDVGEA